MAVMCIMFLNNFYIRDISFYITKLPIKMNSCNEGCSCRKRQKPYYYCTVKVAYRIYNYKYFVKD
ncbi:hypothetical protein EBI_25997 [Enterocytozoon bieneusi H348]|nr:hypothetical protein EBI_25997 [Enterocytozoon bieneusi H348]|eukprot:XP_002650196.1 hypothetical protein EBI_25997 [Enterocytozoon bieneusi H348]